MQEHTGRSPNEYFKPDDKTIQSLSELLEALTDRTKPGFGMYYSAAHMAVARVIRNICAVSNGIEVEVDNKPNYLQMLLKETDDDYKNIGCPKTDVKRFIMDVTQKLKGNTDRLKRIIYIDSLTQTGLKSVIPIVKPYVQGYNKRHRPPDIYQQNEPPKIRTAAFGVFARSYPTLGDLQHVAEETWHEPSIEVGSYVTSTLETLGNSSIPCDQLTASRIKKVLPRIKRFAVGKHHAQNVLTTIFDDIRGFGIEHVLQFTPSNESFIPSTIYAALGYNADSLRDFYYKYAINSQGFNSFNIWDKVLEVFSLHPAESIPKQKDPIFSLSLYHSMLYSNGMLNLGDCKHVGVYHETKIATTYPVKITVAVEEGKYHVSYSFPELPKKVFVYHSEAGTYTTKHNLEAQPTTTEKRVIRTIPSSFVRNSTFGVVGFPLFRSDILTEDISFGYEQVPRNIKEALDQTIEDFLNPGWRRKTVEISRIPDSIFWPPKTEVKMHITLQHEFIKSTSKSNFDFFKKFTIDEVSEKNIISEENLLKEEIKKFGHVYDSLSISVEQKVSDQVTNTAYLHVAYKRTLEGFIHHVGVNATAKVYGLPLGATSNFIAMYFDRPNELKYSEDHYGQQKGIIVGSIRLQDKPYVTAKVILKYKSLEEHLNKGLQKPLPSKYFYPETHEECLEDMKKGKVHSVACIKAIKEHAIYNRMKIHLFWGEDIQDTPIVRDILHKVDIAIKHAFFNHLSVERNYCVIPHYINVDVTYIDKLTDKPVVDVVLQKPSETLKFYKVDPTFIQPISSIYSVPETYVQYHTNNTYPATCTLMKNSVRTYDLKTIHLVRRETCSYILSTHCVRHKKFAVIVKIDPRHPESKEVHLHIGRHSVVLTPGKEWEYEIQYDDKPQTIQYLAEVMLHETEKIYAVVKKPMDGHAFIEIHGEKAGIKVTYDGEHVKIQVHPRYKGELCGLCSEFDGEIVRELRGPDRCLYSSIYDYGNSCALGNCYKSKPEHPHICDTPIYRRMPSEDIDEISRQEYEPKVKRNKVLPKDDKLCFSTRPLPACESQDVIKVKESKEVEFHCLPKSDRLARKLVSESKRRILGELETKEVDITVEVDYPKLCAIQ
ncbi:Vitellogenin like protein [Argiope bruennichi]|uniref:Vitellogenin like protein n=1 Tax=Argiope bruennichi TaxID=94029 RepID=A0A8T0EVH3_ARGBR|nr:Vitellogenin like protein [Argiope bruennichi]